MINIVQPSQKLNMDSLLPRFCESINFKTLKK